MSTALYLNLRGTDIGIERGIDGLTDQGTFLVESEVFQKHRS